MTDDSDKDGLLDGEEEVTYTWSAGTVAYVNRNKMYNQMKIENIGIASNYFNSDRIITATVIFGVSMTWEVEEDGEDDEGAGGESLSP